jgi:hypothetical protein
MRFIYTFDAATKEILTERGYVLLYGSDTKWVFDNLSGAEPQLEDHVYALSNTMTF